MGDQKVFVTIMSIFFGKINTALIVYNKSNIERNKKGKIISSDELTKENREHNKSIGQPTDLKQWRSWWGKKDKDLKKLIKFKEKTL